MALLDSIISFGPFTGFLTFPLTSGGFVVNDGYQGPLVLTSASLTTIYTLAVPSSTAINITASVIGNDNLDGYSYRADFSALVSRVGSAAPTFIGTNPSPLNVLQSTNAVWTGASMSISGNNVILQVGGGTGNTSHWSCAFNSARVA